MMLRSTFAFVYQTYFSGVHSRSDQVCHRSSEEADGRFVTSRMPFLSPKAVKLYNWQLNFHKVVWQQIWGEVVVWISASSQCLCSTFCLCLCLSVSLSLHFNGHLPGEPGLAAVHWSKGWWKRWWQLELWSRALLQSNRHHQQTNTQVFYRLDALPVAQPTVSKHWR